MNTSMVHSLFSRITSEVAALDYFVEQQRRISAAIRSRAWPELEQAMHHAQLAAAMVSEEETERGECLRQLLLELGLPEHTDARTLCNQVPQEVRGMLSGAIRHLRTATMRAKLENEALRSFAGSMAGNLSKIIQELFPERRASTYGRSGTLRGGNTNPVVLDTAW